MTSGYVFKSDTCTLKIPTLMLGESLWGASTCRSRWETHLYFLKTRKGMERGRSIADRTCILNVTVRWLNRPLWGYYNSRLHTALLWQEVHMRHTRHLVLFHRDTRLWGKGVTGKASTYTLLEKKWENEKHIRFFFSTKHLTAPWTRPQIVLASNILGSQCLWSCSWLFLVP